MRSRCQKIASSEQGTSLVETAVLLFLLMLLLAGAIDFGRAYYLANEVAGAAHAGAVYGSQNITDTTGMQEAATLDGHDVSGLSATASWGCECSDNSSTSNQSASCATPPTGCAYNLVYYATVTTTAAYSPLIPWKGINSSITITRSATMRSATE